jgi:phosphonate degradation associated HDIG domain protein
MMMERKLAEDTVNEVFSLYEKFGSLNYIGEQLSQVEHMCQSAQFAEEEGYDEEVILAALFHDIGHLCEFIMPVSHMEDGIGVADHELIGHQLLVGKGFSIRITDLVRSHVSAKRYLTCRNPEYLEHLSSASKKTLEHQGGPMNHEEAVEFESDPLFELYLKMRTWDDNAKITGIPIPDMGHYRDMAIRHLTSKHN